MLKICPYVKCYLLTFVRLFTSPPIKNDVQQGSLCNSLSCRAAGQHLAALWGVTFLKVYQQKQNTTIRILGFHVEAVCLGI